ncbi:arabinose-5-phosphate isomerase [Angulomicrobium tetraedrale]|uniref:Arabinose-5-phosphate isomerase n=1 Tax=Ancylobacter tetraedralis TaxID=217068 RepID=A0A839Z844_9HYPH|nr:KpsF/GutQ family sugar-phosphate isomerase [Ancylobacter tetraedralis]MBB3770428.1 arabinose-5-phosphate isomerase [Ancylobacter tetraedralis]
MTAQGSITQDVTAANLPSEGRPVREASPRDPARAAPASGDVGQSTGQSTDLSGGVPAVEGGPVDAATLDSVRTSALRTLAIEARALAALTASVEGALGDAIARAAQIVEAARGRIIVTGMGKSGHIGRKLAATFASTGTPALFLHAAEASHGDLGMVTPDDVLLAISWSGETAELSDIVHYAGRFAVPLLAMTSRAESSLGRAADVVLALPRVEEACPNGLAPTSSTLIQLALGDALAVALLQRRGFSASDFRVFHPGGKLGARLLKVADLMHRDEALPLVRLGTPMAEALIEITGKRFGCCGVVDATGHLVGIVTDGDLRRHMSAALLAQPVENVMTRSPLVVEPAELASAALGLMNRRPVTVVFAVAERTPVGILHIHDILRAGVI